MKTEVGGMQPQARDAWCPQTLEGARRESSPKPLEGAWPANTSISDVCPPEL